MNKWLSDKFDRARGLFTAGSIKRSVFLAFTISAAMAVLITGVVFYMRYSSQLDESIQSENEILIDEVTQNVNSYLRDMIRISDSLYYNVIKNTDLELEDVSNELQLLYTANNNYIKNIVLFDSTGQAILTAPPSLIKPDVFVINNDWFQNAFDKTENLHFSLPHVQNLVEDSSDTYEWVISLSCAVEITRGKDTEAGVLLIDLRYSGLAESFRNPLLANDGYVYLVGPDGEIISHPRQQLIATGIVSENSQECAKLKEGYYTQKYNGETRTVIVRSVGYTGWKIIGIIPQRGLTFENISNIGFIALIILILLEFLIITNTIITSRLTDPIKKLDVSVQDMEQGRGSHIYSGGSTEVMHLGSSIQSMVDQTRRMSEEMMREHELKQKSELNALQAQINPHFLYNTLDIIVWMIENERPDNAVKLVTSLARLFRISLSKGRNIIAVSDELEHVRNYLTIQLMRYKDKFRYTIDIPEEMTRMSIIKLVLQPIIENAIYHSMDFMDGDGLITISGRMENAEMFITVADNGMGIPPQMIQRLLTDYVSSGSSGSGIGLKNVNERIKLYFGEEYGVSIESELDVGTNVTLHLPAIPFGDMKE